MRKLLFIGLLTILLFGCSNVSDNVDQGLAKDSLQVLDIINDNVKDDIAYEDINKEDKKIVDDYKDKYLNRSESIEYDGANEDIRTLTGGNVARFLSGINLESDKEDMKKSKELAEEVIKTGEPVE